MSKQPIDDARDPRTARLVLACLDLTRLDDADSAIGTAALAARARGPAGAPAALCVWPRFVAQARALAPAAVRVAAVANFPDGALDLARALHDTRQIVAAGGDEVDLVLPWRAWRDGAAAETAALLRAVRRACRELRLKLIIESGELRDPELIRAACLLGLDCGADFLKTSTGKTPVGATADAAQVMLETIADHSRGAAVGFKASGGIRRIADAAVYIALVRQILGPAALTPQRLRFGASALLDDIEAVLGGKSRTG